MKPQNVSDFKEVEDLFIRYSRPAYGLAIKILRNTDLAEDAVQEAFLKYWKNPSSYNPALAPFVNWIMTVVRNICLDYLRKNTRLDVVSFSGDENADWIETIVDQGKLVEEEVLENLQRNQIHYALKSIPLEQQSLIELAFFKGLSHSQIATEVGLPVGTVKSRIRQGLLKLKTYLEMSKVIELHLDNYSPTAA